MITSITSILVSTGQLPFMMMLLAMISMQCQETTTNFSDIMVIIL
jgi:hypothetical protein